jgi:endonuclease III
MVPDAVPGTALVRQARRINRELALLYPDAGIELTFASPLELLVAAVLSARSTDRTVNEVTKVPFGRYRTAADYAAADEAELQKVIAPTGSFRTKAKTLIALGQALCHRSADNFLTILMSSLPFRASAARQPTWFSAARSASRASS